MVVKEKKPNKTNVFEGYNARQQTDIEKIVSEYDVLFQEPMMFCFKNLKVCHPKRK